MDSLMLQVRTNEPSERRLNQFSTMARILGINREKRDKTQWALCQRMCNIPKKFIQRLVNFDSLTPEGLAELKAYAKTEECNPPVVQA